MTQKFHDQLEALRTDTARMGALARSLLLEGVQSLVDLDARLADDVVKRDQELNRLDVQIERDALDLLALNQPMAAALRTLGATLKMITYLDRIGRYGYDVALVTKQMKDQTHPRKLVTIPHMAKLAAQMVQDAVDAYTNRDLQKARGVFPQDELVDALNDEIFRECVTYMVEDPRTIGVYAHYILVARHLERAGDNANKIAEKVVYMITGERRLTL